MRHTTLRFIITVVLGLLLSPLASAEQPQARPPRLGIFWLGAPAPSAPLFEAFRQVLDNLGYVEGQNIDFEHRSAPPRIDQLDRVASELVQFNVDVIVALGTPQAQPAKRATTQIAIVFTAVADPVAAGLVESLARPGGNLTGVASLSPEQSGKRLELLTAALPGVSRIAVLWNPADRYNAFEVSVMETVAHGLGVQLQSLEVRGPDEFERAFDAATQEGAGALSVLATSFIALNMRRIVDLALQHRLPAIFWSQAFAEAGGLMAYGPSRPEAFQRVAALVGKILKGAKPADLPVEQPMKFELMINLKTAEALGLTIPPILLFQADQVIR
jgi:putative tryptophan/tyrosine transport system substrate-binding protein